MSEKQELERLRSLVWDLKQRYLEGTNDRPSGRDAQYGWTEAWAEVVEAMETWGVDPETLHGDTASAAAGVCQAD